MHKTGVKALVLLYGLIATTLAVGAVKTMGSVIQIQPSNFGSTGIPDRKIAVVAGVIRNTDDGQGWKLISNGTHGNINVSSVVSGGAQIDVNYDTLDAIKVISFIAAPDETLAAAQFFCGATVTTTKATVYLKRTRQVADYVSYNGTNWVSANSVFVSPSFSSGILTLATAQVMTGAFMAVSSISGSDGAYIPQFRTLTATSTQISFYDWAGGIVNSPDTGMKAYINRGFVQATENPNTVNETTFPGGNIWFYGVFEVN